MELEFVTDAGVQDHRTTEVVDEADGGDRLLARTRDVRSVSVDDGDLWVRRGDESFALSSAEPMTVVEEDGEGLRVSVRVTEPDRIHGREGVDGCVPVDAGVFDFLYRDVASATEQDGGVQLELKPDASDRGDTEHVFVDDGSLSRADTSLDEDLLSGGPSRWVEVESGRQANSGYAVLKMSSSSNRTRVEHTEHDGSMVRAVYFGRRGYEVWVKRDMLDMYGEGLRRDEKLSPDAEEAVALKHEAKGAHYNGDVTPDEIDVDRLLELLRSPNRRAREEAIQAVSYVAEERASDCVDAVPLLVEYVRDALDAGDTDGAVSSAVRCLNGIAETEPGAVASYTDVLLRCLTEGDLPDYRQEATQETLETLVSL